MKTRKALLGAALLVAVASAALAAAAAPPVPRLKVSANGHYLVTAAGKPFFWLGDTAWSLCRIGPKDVDFYMSTRAAQGFDVIQVDCGYHVKNHYGDAPFIDNDTDKPNPAFWRYMDTIVAKAGQHGLHIALVPMWGSEYREAFGGDAAKAGRFGRWIASRYAGLSQVIWIVSGEYTSINHFHLPIKPWQKKVLEAAAEGIRSVSKGAQLMTIHPGSARSSSLDFDKAPWLDFNMLQSGHIIDCEAAGRPENHTLVAHDFALKPPKPVLDGEPIYEDTPDGIWIHGGRTTGPRAKPADVRRKAYWAVFAGACGQTYGHNDVWCFYEPPKPGEKAPAYADSGQRETWREALKAPGGTEMKYVRDLMLSRPYLSRVPDQSLIAAGQGTHLDYDVATRDADGSYAMVYIPSGRPVTVALGKLAGKRLVAWWFDPRTGTAHKAGEFARAGERRFTPPTSGRGQDWVLVLDDAARHYPQPGT